MGGGGGVAEDRADLIVLIGLLLLQLSLLLVELPREVGLRCPPQLVGIFLPVVQEFGLEQATCVHLGH